MSFPVRYVIVAAILGCTAWGAYALGDARVQARWDAEKLAVSSHQSEVAQEQIKVETRVVTEYVDRVRTIHTQGATIIKEIPVYVTRADDSRCTVNNGFVSVWNSANTGLQLSDTAAIADAEASGIRLSDVATQHAAESRYTLELEARLVALQAWVAGMSARK